MHDDRLRAAVTAYARRFNATFAGGGHSVTSPLGAWLLLAAATTAATGTDRDALERLLGFDAETAKDVAGELIADPHPAVKAAFAAWANTGLVTDGWTAWAARLPEGTEHGPVPTQPDADEWARRRTDGLIASFPIALEELTAIVLATAVATRITWSLPFSLVGAAELDGRWSAAVSHVLRAPREHAQLLVETRAAGIVGAHAAWSVDGVIVVSVIADPTVGPIDVHDAAHEVAALMTRSASPAHRVSLFDVPLGSGHAWTITERRTRAVSGDDRIETFDTVLPAWTASGTHDLIGAGVGFDELAAGLGVLVRPELGVAGVQARQTAVAAYSRVGFDAAAVTAISVLAGSAMPLDREVVERRCELRFDRPYAAVAVATTTSAGGAGPSTATGAAWDGLPVFSAWVAEPAEAS